MPKHGSIRKVYACLAVTCHLHFWLNDRDFLRATVVTRGWNGYRNKSQHRNGQSLRFFTSGFKKKMKHGNVLSKNIDCFRCAIDMQIREAKVHSECNGGR